jgi:hypothetical protein
VFTGTEAERAERLGNIYEFLTRRSPGREIRTDGALRRLFDGFGLRTHNIQPLPIDREFLRADRMERISEAIASRGYHNDGSITKLPEVWIPRGDEITDGYDPLNPRSSNPYELQAGRYLFHTVLEEALHVLEHWDQSAALRRTPTYERYLRVTGRLFDSEAYIAAFLFEHGSPMDEIETVVRGRKMPSYQPRAEFHEWLRATNATPQRPTAWQHIRNFRAWHDGVHRDFRITRFEVRGPETARFSGGAALRAGVVIVPTALAGGAADSYVTSELRRRGYRDGVADAAGITAGLAVSEGGGVVLLATVGGQGWGAAALSTAGAAPIAVPAAVAFHQVSEIRSGVDEIDRMSRKVAGHQAAIPTEYERWYDEWPFSWMGLDWLNRIKRRWGFQPSDGWW